MTSKGGCSHLYNSQENKGLGRADKPVSADESAEGFVLKLTEPEMTAIWSLLTVAELRKDQKRARNPVDQKLDRAMKSALDKVQRLMETPEPPK